MQETTVLTQSHYTWNEKLYVFSTYLGLLLKKYYS